MLLEVDLNDIPADTEVTEVVTVSARHGSHDRQVNGLVGTSTSVTGSTTIDVDAIDEDVMISSPRRFAEARNNSKRKQVVTVVLDEDAGVHQSQPEEPMTRLVLNSFSESLYLNLGSSKSLKRKGGVMPSEEPTAKTVPQEPVFTCAICMGPLVKETSTTCGHIFCMKCIRTAIATQKRCPTCRRKLTGNSIHRVYLPTTN